MERKLGEGDRGGGGNILRGVEENQLKGSAASISTESLPVVRVVAHSLFKRNKQTV